MKKQAEAHMAPTPMTPWIGETDIQDTMEATLVRAAIRKLKQYYEDAPWDVASNDKDEVRRDAAKRIRALMAYWGDDV